MSVAVMTAMKNSGMNSASSDTRRARTGSVCRHQRKIASAGAMEAKIPNARIASGWSVSASTAVSHQPIIGGWS